MKSILAVALLLTAPAWAFHKDFALVNDRAPLEFRLLFETMRTTLTEPEDQIRLVAFCQRINRGLGPLKKDQAFFLLKGEVYKTLLEWPFPPAKSQNIGPHTLPRLKALLQTNKSVYTPYSTWVVEALVADLAPFEQEGFFAMTEAQKAALEGPKLLRLRKLQRILKHTAGWVQRADAMSGLDFNQLTRSLAWRTLERVNERALLFRRHSSQAVQETLEVTFNIPESGLPRPVPPKPEDAPPPVGVGDQAAQAKQQAGAALENVQATPADVPAEDLSQIIDDVETELKSKKADPALE